MGGKRDNNANVIFLEKCGKDLKDTLAVASVFRPLRKLCAGASLEDNVYDSAQIVTLPTTPLSTPAIFHKGNVCSVSLADPTPSFPPWRVMNCILSAALWTVGAVLMTML